MLHATMIMKNSATPKKMSRMCSCSSLILRGALQAGVPTHGHELVVIGAEKPFAQRTPRLYGPLTVELLALLRHRQQPQCLPVDLVRFQHPSLQGAAPGPARWR